jgi:hypothetical protein
MRWFALIGQKDSLASIGGLKMMVAIPPPFRRHAVMPLCGHHNSYSRWYVGQKLPLP